MPDLSGWRDIGIGHNARPYACKDGDYRPIDQYQYNDTQPIGIELVFEHAQPVVGGVLWILNPDLVVALGLIKEGPNWVRLEEDPAVVARVIFDDEGHHRLIEVKREFLIDYLAARNLSYRMRWKWVAPTGSAGWTTSWSKVAPAASSETRAMRSATQYRLRSCFRDEVSARSAP